MAWNGCGTQGGNAISRGVSPKTGKGKRHLSWQFTIVIAVLAVAIAGIVVWFAAGDNGGDAPRENRPTKKQEVKEARPVDKRNVELKASTTASIKEPEKPKAKILGKTPTGLEYVAHVAQTNNDGVVVSRYQLPDGTWTRVVQLQSKDSLVFETALDNQLALIAMTPVNQMLPPMPPLGNLEEAFREAIKHPIIINETDSEKARELKEAVKDIRLQIADLLREGYTVNQILAEDASLRTKNVEFRRELQKELNDIYRTEGREAAEEYMEIANEKLEEQGVIPLSMPESGNSRKRRN